jgi:hypothetical protein
MPIGAAIGAGASLLGGLIGSHGAHEAADAQQEAAAKAQQVAQQNQQSSTDYQTGVAQEQRGALSPYNTAGQGAIGQLSQLTQPGGDLLKGYQDFNAPTGVNEQNDPGYQFRLQQGQQALQNSAAARGGLLTGGTAKALNDYAQNSASQEYGNVYNRALQGYQTNANNFYTNQANTYGRLAGLGQQGLQAGSTLGSLLQSGSQNINSINQGATNQINQQLNNQGAAQASGIVGSANAWNGALGGVMNNVPSSWGNYNPFSNASSASPQTSSGYVPPYRVND